MKSKHHLVATNLVNASDIDPIETTTLLSSLRLSSEEIESIIFSCLAGDVNKDIDQLISVFEFYKLINPSSVSDIFITLMQADVEIYEVTWLGVFFALVAGEHPYAVFVHSKLKKNKTIADLRIKDFKNICKSAQNNKQLIKFLKIKLKLKGLV